MISRFISFVVVICIALGVFAEPKVMASENSFANAASNSIVPFLIIGEVSLLKDKKEAVQGAKAIAATAVITTLLKYTVREERPNGESLTSFPSGHTSAVFAMATVISDFKPKYTWPAFITASVIGWSRVETGAHYWHDVAAGALIGTVIAKQFTSSHLVATPNGIAIQFKF